MTLFHHKDHPHVPQNVNDLHRAEQTGLNTKIAVILTKCTGTMWTAYGFLFLALIGLAGILGMLHPVVIVFIAWLSQTFLQLVLLPIIMVGQNVLSRKQELQSDETFATTEKIYHDLGQLAEHLAAQDAVIVEIHEYLKGEKQHGA